MNSPQNQRPSDGPAEPATLELYKTAFARLSFQDDYLFKFSTVFLTAHGALAVLAGTAYFQKSPPEYGALVALGIAMPRTMRIGVTTPIKKLAVAQLGFSCVRQRLARTKHAAVRAPKATKNPSP